MMMESKVVFVMDGWKWGEGRGKMKMVWSLWVLMEGVCCLDAVIWRRRKKNVLKKTVSGICRVKKRRREERGRSEEIFTWRRRDYFCVVEKKRPTWGWRKRREKISSTMPHVSFLWSKINVIFANKMKTNITIGLDRREIFYDFF